MQLSKLRGLYKDCRTNPNYIHRELAEDQFVLAAKKSFHKLTPKQMAQVQKSWATCIKSAGETLTTETAEELFKFRYLAQTNLFFLCHLLEQYSQTTLGTHEEICNGFFVAKDPTFPSFEQFANQYTDLKDRMLLVPRGGFKSSIDIADCVQWVICFPAITILILTGVYKLASDFVGELKQHFTLEESGNSDSKGKMTFANRKIMDKETAEWSESLFQVLFAEHCVPPGDGPQFEFETPAAMGGEQREPTVRAASIEQALSGMHFGVLKSDDVVTNENSLTIDRLEKINKQISVNRAMLHPYGFNDVIGTWYHEQDFYGITIAQEEKFALEEGLTDNIKGSVDSGKFNSSVYVKVYLRSAWFPTEEAAKAGKIADEMKKDDYDLWFPERLSYEFLTKEKKKDPDGFAVKYLNNPRVINRVKFPRELLLRRTIPHSQLPPQGIVVTAVDTAYSTKSWADYTVIMTALIYGGRFYVINMVRGRFNEYDLPVMIANAGNKWKPKRIAIEDSVGVKWMGRELRREMDKLRISIPVEYCSLGFGSKLRSKQLKAKPVLRLLGDERLFFLNSCEGLEEIYSEMEKFTGTSDDKHDDIVSAISLLVEQFGAFADMDSRITQVSMDFVADKMSKARHDQIYGLGNYGRYNASSMQDDNPTTQFELGNIPMSSAGEFFDPLADLM
jgi:phage terminase large subunit-like protein